jgi:hypothetical protein
MVWYGIEISSEFGTIESICFYLEVLFKVLVIYDTNFRHFAQTKVIEMIKGPIFTENGILSTIGGGGT